MTNGQASRAVDPAETVLLEAGDARAEILPALGGGLGTLTVGGKTALRPWSRKTDDDPFALGMIVLAPFSNRIGGGFNLNGQWHALAPNVAGERYPLHGDAYGRAWQIVDHGHAHLSLLLTDGHFGPWRYSAQLDYHLTETGLVVALALQNRADMTLPYGLGFHPWFPRSAQTRLCFSAQSVWQVAEDQLPTAYAPEAIPPEWRFDRPSPLPERRIDNAFAAWTGPAEISQGPEAVSLRVSASENLDCALVFAPDPGREFFCFEPVSHPPNAINMPHRPGLVDLAPEAELAGTMTLQWS